MDGIRSEKCQWIDRRVDGWRSIVDGGAALMEAIIEAFMDGASMDESSMDESPMEDNDVHGWNVTDEGSPIPRGSSVDGASSMDGLVIGFDTGERPR